MSIDSQDKVALCPAALQTIIAQFQEATPRERLEYLLEYAMDLPDMPSRLQEKRDEMEQVHECQTPVFLHTELNDGKVEFFFDIPPESPTVRGYASILAEGLNQTTPAEVLTTPDDVYHLLGLHEAITPQRLRGLHALLVYMKRQVQKLV
ncbi:MAG: SufE family protein [Chloroflexi bacterium]|nr:SufE family protein [Chloroflexota bacterium]